MLSSSPSPDFAPTDPAAPWVDPSCPPRTSCPLGPPTGTHAPTLRQSLAAGCRTALWALLLFLVVRSCAVQVYTVPSPSMEPTLLVGDYVVVAKWLDGPRVPLTRLHLPGVRRPRRGDVIVFSPPFAPTVSFVKRVVGLPGDTLAMRDKALFRNGVRVAEPYARWTDASGAHPTHFAMAWQRSHLLASTPRDGYAPTRDTWGPVVVPPDSLFVLGDNRDESADSRYWGLVPMVNVEGRPVTVWWSQDAHGRRRPGRSWVKVR